MIMPGVTIGDECIIGACSVVTRSIPPNSIAVGSPAKVIGKTSDYIEKHRELMKTAPVYDQSWTVHQGITEEMKAKMSQDLDNGETGYII